MSEGSPRWDLRLAVAGAAVVVVGGGTVAGLRLTAGPPPPAFASAPVDGFSLHGAKAPGFTLVDQFGRTTSLSQFRGKEVVWAFIDDQCTTDCPITAEALRGAVASLGPAAKGVQLVAVNANPTATSVAQVRKWSAEHQMLHQWEFLTGTRAQLEKVYASYKVSDQVSGQGSAATIFHDPAVIVIDPSGRERLYYETLPTNASTTVRAEIKGWARGMRQWLPST
ncbi:MAG: SCO family protein [Acidimicrobiales bacterium]